jgi:hypothetical protein
MMIFEMLNALAAVARSGEVFDRYRDAAGFEPRILPRQVPAVHFTVDTVG